MSLTEASYVGQLGACVPTQETLRQRLERKKKHLDASLSEVNAALAILDKSPEMEQFHDAIVRAGY